MLKFCFYIFLNFRNKSNTSNLFHSNPKSNLYKTEVLYEKWNLNNSEKNERRLDILDYLTIDSLMTFKKILPNCPKTFLNLKNISFFISWKAFIMQIKSDWKSLFIIEHFKQIFKSFIRVLIFINFLNKYPYKIHL